jgi:hypothetical protein
MTTQEFKQLVIDLIDQNCMKLSLSDYAEAMEDLSIELSDKAAAARNDLEDGE